MTDGLTGLYNHRHFYERLEHEIARARRYGTPSSSLLMIDLDDFKLFNDRNGHLAGTPCCAEWPRCWCKPSEPERGGPLQRRSHGRQHAHRRHQQPRLEIRTSPANCWRGRGARSRRHRPGTGTARAGARDASARRSAGHAVPRRRRLDAATADGEHQGRHVALAPQRLRKTWWGTPTPRSTPPSVPARTGGDL